MARYGINPVNTLGVSAPDIWEVARAVGRDHDLALALWDSAIHDARHVAAAVDEPERVTSAQMERWVKDLDSWDVCDGVCGKLFDKTPHAWRKAAAWTKRREEFVRRAGFVLMAALAVHDKEAPDDRFLAFFPLIERGAPGGGASARAEGVRPPFEARTSPPIAGHLPGNGASCPPRSRRRHFQALQQVRGAADLRPCPVTYTLLLLH
jgi:hypothetical protein